MGGDGCGVDMSGFFFSLDVDELCAWRLEWREEPGDI